MQSARDGKRPGPLQPDATPSQQPVPRGPPQRTPSAPAPPASSSPRNNVTWSPSLGNYVYDSPRTLPGSIASPTLSTGSYPPTRASTESRANSNYVTISSGLRLPTSTPQPQPASRYTNDVPLPSSAVPASAYYGALSQAQDMPATQPSPTSTRSNDGGRSSNDGQISTQWFHSKYIVIRFGGAEIRLKIWRWLRANTDARLLRAGVKADTMLSLENGKTIGDYSQRQPPERFFTCGRVFAIPWSQETHPEVQEHITSQGWSAVTRRMNNSFIQEVRFVVLVNSNGEFCTAAPVAIDSDFTPLPGQRPDSGLIHSDPPSQVPVQIADPRLQYVHIRSDDLRERLPPGSWIGYGAVCSIMVDLPVRPIGVVADESMGTLVNQFKIAWTGKSGARDAPTESRPSRSQPQESSYEASRRRSPPREERAQRPIGTYMVSDTDRRPPRRSPSPSALASTMGRLRIAQPDVAESSAGATRGLSERPTGVVSIDAMRQYLERLREVAQTQHLPMFRWPEQGQMQRLAVDVPLRQKYLDNLMAMWRNFKSGSG